MIDENIAVIDIDPFQWGNLLQWLQEQAVLYVCYEKTGLPIFAYHTRLGCVSIKLVISNDRIEEEAKELAGQYQVDTVILFTPETLRDFFDTIQASVSLEFDWDEYMFRALACLLGDFRDKIHVVGDRFSIITGARGLCERLKTEGECVCFFGAFDGEDLWTSLLLFIRHGRITVLTTLDSIVPEATQGIRWQTESREIARKVVLHFNAPTVGALMTKECLKGVIVASDKERYLLEEAKRGSLTLFPSPDEFASFFFGEGDE